MGASDFFYYVVAVGFVVAVVVWVFLAFQITRTLEDIRKILQDVGSTTGDINAVKDAIKYGVSSLGSILGHKARSYAKKKFK